jgi:hypothetical protein
MLRYLRQAKLVRQLLEAEQAKMQATADAEVAVAEAVTAAAAAATVSNGVEGSPAAAAARPRLRLSSCSARASAAGTAMQPIHKHPKMVLALQVIIVTGSSPPVREHHREAVLATGPPARLPCPARATLVLLLAWRALPKGTTDN